MVLKETKDIMTSFMVAPISAGVIALFFMAGRYYFTNTFDIIIPLQIFLYGTVIIFLVIVIGSLVSGGKKIFGIFGKPFGWARKALGSKKKEDSETASATNEAAATATAQEEETQQEDEDPYARHPFQHNFPESSQGASRVAHESKAAMEFYEDTHTQIGEEAPYILDHKDKFEKLASHIESAHKHLTTISEIDKKDRKKIVKYVHDEEPLLVKFIREIEESLALVGGKGAVRQSFFGAVIGKERSMFRVPAGSFFGAHAGLTIPLLLIFLTFIGLYFSGFSLGFVKATSYPMIIGGASILLFILFAFPARGLRIGETKDKYHSWHATHPFASKFWLTVGVIFSVLMLIIDTMGGLAGTGIYLASGPLLLVVISKIWGSIARQGHRITHQDDKGLLGEWEEYCKALDAAHGDNLYHHLKSQKAAIEHSQMASPLHNSLTYEQYEQKLTLLSHESARVKVAYKSAKDFLLVLKRDLDDLDKELKTLLASLGIINFSDMSKLELDKDTLLSFKQIGGKYKKIRLFIEKEFSGHTPVHQPLTAESGGSVGLFDAVDYNARGLSYLLIKGGTSLSGRLTVLNKRLQALSASISAKDAKHKEGRSAEDISQMREFLLRVARTIPEARLSVSEVNDWSDEDVMAGYRYHYAKYGHLDDS